MGISEWYSREGSLVPCDYSFYPCVALGQISMPGARERKMRLLSSSGLISFPWLPENLIDLFCLIHTFCTVHAKERSTKIVVNSCQLPLACWQWNTWLTAFRCGSFSKLGSGTSLSKVSGVPGLHGYLTAALFNQPNFYWVFSSYFQKIKFVKYLKLGMQKWNCLSCTATFWILWKSI